MAATRTRMTLSDIGKNFYFSNTSQCDLLQLQHRSLHFRLSLLLVVFHSLKKKKPFFEH